MQQGKFTLTDFQAQMISIRKMGSVSEIIKMIPGFNLLPSKEELKRADDEMRQIEGVINAMTLRERANPEVIDNSRRCRIARGSACDPRDVDRLLKQFADMTGLMEKMAGKRR